jgi:hypothetical protein
LISRLDDQSKPSGASARQCSAVIVAAESDEISSDEDESVSPDDISDSAVC